VGAGGGDRQRRRRGATINIADITIPTSSDTAQVLSSALHVRQPEKRMLVVEPALLPSS
jgi:hypothetical protein